MLEFWIIENGEKVGPLEDFRLREMINEGRVKSETLVWHEGAEGWKKACEVPIFEGEFESKVLLPPPLPMMMTFGPFLAWRRLGARVFDFFLYHALFYGCLRVMGMSILPDPAVGLTAWMIIATVVPAILMEAALVSSWGYTPGKWLMSLRVETREGKVLTTGASVVRTMRVWVLGMGMTHPLLMLLGHGITLWFGLKKGAPLWDLQTGYRVPGGELLVPRVVFFWVSLVGLVVICLRLLWPELEPLMGETRAN